MESLRLTFETQDFRRLRVKDLKSIIRELKHIAPRKFNHMNMGGRKENLVASIQSALSQIIIHLINHPPIPVPAVPVPKPFLARFQPPKLSTEQLAKIYKTSIASPTRSPFFEVHTAAEPLKLLEFNFANTPTLEFIVTLKDKYVYETGIDSDDQLHLVMIDLKSNMIPFNRNFTIRINSIEIEPAEPPRAKGTKKKGLLVYSPLNVTPYANIRHTSIRIMCKSDLFTKSMHGVLALEVSKKLTTEEVFEKHLKHLKSYEKPLNTGSPTTTANTGSPTITAKKAPSTSLTSAQSPPLIMVPKKECYVCRERNDLLRCSRCKKIWYCGTKHQREDWNRHRAECFDSDDSAAAAKAASIYAERAEHCANLAVAAAQACVAHHAANSNSRIETGKKRSYPGSASSVTASSSDDLLETDIVLSIRCPLSIVGKIERAAKGRHCLHPQCFDLMSFILISEQSSVWQCPVCLKPLPMRDIIVDEDMTRAIQGCDEEVTQIRRSPEGKFTPVVPKNPSEKKKKKKRRKKERVREPFDPSSLFADVNESVPQVRTNPVLGSNNNSLATTTGTYSNLGSSAEDAIVLD